MDGVGTLFTAGAVIVVIDVADRVMAIVIVPRDRLLTAAMAWLLAVFFVPVIGVLLFLLIGNPKLPEQRRLKQQEMTRSSRLSRRAWRHPAIRKIGGSGSTRW